MAVLKSFLCASTILKYSGPAEVELLGTNGDVPFLLLLSVYPGI